MTEEGDVELRVAEARHRDVGRGIARIETGVMSRLGVVSGDVIELQGKRTVPALVWPGYPDDTGSEIVRVDGNIRGNLKVALDDRIKIRKAKVSEAKEITVISSQRVRIAGGPAHVRRVLQGRPVVKGQNVRIQVLGSPRTFTIQDTNPEDVVLMRPDTRVNIKTAETGKPPETKGTRVTYEDIGGLRREIELVREMVELPLRHPELFQRMGIEPPKGILLYGPPGTGKTLIAKAVANETFANFLFISGPEVMARYYGESEQRIREIFQKAESNSPAIIFIDEFDSIAPKREEVGGEKQVEKRVVAQLLSLMDGLETRGEVVVIAATNRPGLIDEALRRGGRFDREIEIGVPDRNGRKEILQVHTRGMPLADDVNLKNLADLTHGFVGADLSSLCKEAAMHALREVARKIEFEKEIPPEVLKELQVTNQDFNQALRNVEPSAMREVFVEVPQVNWDDVGGLEESKRHLIEAVEWPLRFPEAFETLGTAPAKGVLLFGPPGTGKTMLAKAVATESNANFIAIKGPEIFNKFVGESERAVREIFRKARQVAPAVIFFDEIESIASDRGFATDSQVGERVVSQLLTELDGIEDTKQVVVLAATNRPDLVDSALLRPGRLERLIYVCPPNQKEREEIFNIHLSGLSLDPSVDVEELSRMTESYVGADIESLCRQAAVLAMRNFIKPSMDRDSVVKGIKNVQIGKNDLHHAVASLKPVALHEKLTEYVEIAEGFARPMEAEISQMPKGGTSDDEG